MINTRILELVKNPHNIQQRDLVVLEKEISRYPYVQSFRALYLLGTRMFDENNYQYELSKTAAYTTNKKILRDFVNPENRDFSFEQNTENQLIDIEKEISDEEVKIQNTENQSIDNEKEILDEEVEIQNTENQSIDNEKEILDEEVKIQNTENQLIDNEKEILDEEVKIQNTENQLIDNEYSEEVSFHNTDAFLPNMNIIKKEEEKYIPPKSGKVSKHEIEMQRLIAEVEAKMKAKKAKLTEKNKQEKEPIEEQTANDEISFSETQDFNFSEIKKDEPALEEKRVVSKKETENNEWKPMSLVQELPDSYIEKKEKVSDIQEVKEGERPEIEEERPVLNVSFFSENILEKQEEKKEESNVSEFIMTWQKWLNPEFSTDEIKEKAIETFIENEPKISKRKEETSFVMKEKDDDISHLMTETLVKLYLDQRLYAKAIDGYKILQEKYPDKHKEFEQKIEEIKQIKIGKP